jgi:uncharacterized protein (UPF0333 family)
MRSNLDSKEMDRFFESDQISLPLSLSNLIIILIVSIHHIVTELTILLNNKFVIISYNKYQF